MLKLPDSLNISPGLSPVGRLVPVIAVDNIGAPLQELSARATQFALGREYSAQILSKVDDKAYLVKVDNTVLKMDLGNAAQAGQAVSLRYVQDGPLPTFLLLPQASAATSGATELSSAARLIGQYLQEAEKHGVSNKFEASAVVTHSPKDPQMIAQGLRQAFSNSGLFYESHLNEMLHGARSVASVMQEPQNQNANQVPTLTAQQLVVLEQSRVNWHGEVWPGQKMEWDVYSEPEDEQPGESSDGANENTRPVISEIKLDFPNLGAVSAKLTIVDGHVSINLRAEQDATLDTFKRQSQGLTQAIGNAGLQLDGLMISSYE